MLLALVWLLTTGKIIITFSLEADRAVNNKVFLINPIAQRIDQEHLIVYRPVSFE
jgi:hypothetical protein